MMLLVFSVFFSVFLACVVFFVVLSLSFRFLLDREKASPFECGFDPKGSARVPFSMRFFLLAVIFLIFDVEISLLIPFPMYFLIGWGVFGVCSCFFFIFILLFGVYYEWEGGSLDWVGWDELV